MQYSRHHLTQDLGLRDRGMAPIGIRDGITKPAVLNIHDRSKRALMRIPGCFEVTGSLVALHHGRVAPHVQKYDLRLRSLGMNPGDHIVNACNDLRLGKPRLGSVVHVIRAARVYDQRRIGWKPRQFAGEHPRLITTVDGQIYRFASNERCRNSGPCDGEVRDVDRSVVVSGANRVPQNDERRSLAVGRDRSK